MPPEDGPGGGVHAVSFRGSWSGQLMHVQAITAPCRRQAQVVPG